MTCLGIEYSIPKILLFRLAYFWGFCQETSRTLYNVIVNGGLNAVAGENDFRENGPYLENKKKTGKGRQKCSPPVH